MKRPWWSISRPYAVRAAVLALVLVALVAYHMLGGPSSVGQ